MKPIFSIFNFLKGLKTTKFLEVPSGTAIKMYGKDADDNLVEDDVPSGGATAFTELSDVPQSYTDQAGKMLVVNEGETALEFINTTEISDGHTHSNKTDLDNYDPDDFALVGHNHNLNDLTEKSYNSLTDKPTIPAGMPSGTNEQTLRNSGGTWAATDIFKIGSGTSSSKASITYASSAEALLISNLGGVNSKGLKIETISTSTQYLLQAQRGTTKFEVNYEGTIYSASLTASKLVATNSSKKLVSTDLIALSGGSVVKMLTADATRESNTTLAAVSDFTQALLASSKYRIVAKLSIHQAGGEADFKMQLAAPSGSSITGCYKIWNDGVNTQVTNNLYNDLTAVKNIEMDAYSDSAGYYYIEIEGVIETSTTAGNITFSFAQLNSNAEITTLKKYSIIELTKI